MPGRDEAELCDVSPCLSPMLLLRELQGRADAPGNPPGAR